MAGAEGWQFVLFTLVFYGFIGFILFTLNGWAFMATSLEGYVQPSCVPLLAGYRWVPASEINTTILQSLPNSTFIKADVIFGRLNQTFVINSTTNATWFTPIKYECYMYGENASVLYSVRYDTIKYVGVLDATVTGIECQEVTNTNFLTTIWLLFTNPFSAIGFISWLTLAFVAVDIFIIFTSLIP